MRECGCGAHQGGRAGTPYRGAMADSLPPCPECSSEFTYEMGALLVCPECAHEWAGDAAGHDADAGERVIRDAVGNVLADGDTVTGKQSYVSLPSTGSVPVRGAMWWWIRWWWGKSTGTRASAGR